MKKRLKKIDYISSFEESDISDSSSDDWTSDEDYNRRVVKKKKFQFASREVPNYCEGVWSVEYSESLQKKKAENANPQEQNVKEDFYRETLIWDSFRKDLHSSDKLIAKESNEVLDTVVNFKNLAGLEEQCKDVDKLVEEYWKENMKAMKKFEEGLKRRAAMFEELVKQNVKVVGEKIRVFKLLHDRSETNDFGVVEGKETALTKLLLMCADALEVVFQFLSTSDLLKNISMTCSFFYNVVVKRVPLEIDMDTFWNANKQTGRLMSKYMVRSIVFSTRRLSFIGKNNKNKQLTSLFNENYSSIRKIRFKGCSSNRNWRRSLKMLFRKIQFLRFETIRQQSEGKQPPIPEIILHILKCTKMNTLEFGFNSSFFAPKAFVFLKGLSFLQRISIDITLLSYAQSIDLQVHEKKMKKTGDAEHQQEITLLSFCEFLLKQVSTLQSLVLDSSHHSLHAVSAQKNWWDCFERVVTTICNTVLPRLVNLSHFEFPLLYWKICNLDSDFFLFLLNVDSVVVDLLPSYGHKRSKIQEQRLDGPISDCYDGRVNSFEQFIKFWSVDAPNNDVNQKKKKKKLIRPTCNFLGETAMLLFLPKDVDIHVVVSSSNLRNWPPDLGVEEDASSIISRDSITIICRSNVIFQSLVTIVSFFSQTGINRIVIENINLSQSNIQSNFEFFQILLFKFMLADNLKRIEMFFSSSICLEMKLGYIYFLLTLFRKKKNLKELKINCGKGDFKKRRTKHLLEQLKKAGVPKEISQNQWKLKQLVVKAIESHPMLENLSVFGLWQIEIDHLYCKK